jgi:hypothetical protein
MATVTINMTLAEWSRYMARLGSRFYPAAVRGAQSGALRCIGIMQRRTDFAPPATDGFPPGAVDTGQYKASWQSAPLSNGASVFNSRGYSAVIDYGRRAAAVGKSGIKNLEGWAKRKLGLSGDAATSAAYAIAQTLKDKPLRARKVMSGGVDEMTKAVQDDIQHELDVELTRK